MTVKPLIVETAFGAYTLTELLGEGGAGRVYGGTSPDAIKVAVKLLSADKATKDKRRRFKNEIAFLSRNTHPNIVSVIDHGVTHTKGASEPFYVMRRYDCNLRDLLPTLSFDEILPIFGKILDGVEAAHLQGAIHRDLKPENILFDKKSRIPAVADFGVGSFTDDIVATIVETEPARRLANFQYAAPEQRASGRPIDKAADIYALGLVLNEMFTSNVPHGTEYQQISSIKSDFAYLDSIVALMIRQAPTERYASIQDIKGAISIHRAEFLSLQKISQIDSTVIPQGAVDDPLAHDPPKLVDLDYANGTLILRLDRPVHSRWIRAFRELNVSYIMNADPQNFAFEHDTVTVAAPDRIAQQVINSFKGWLPLATRALHETLRREAQNAEHQAREKLKREKAAEEHRLDVLRRLHI
jgi:serine/threonine protein kinase